MVLYTLILTQRNYVRAISACFLPDDPRLLKQHPVIFVFVRFIRGEIHVSFFSLGLE